MNTSPTRPVITVLCGGISPEREVSLGSGYASAMALAQFWPTRLVEVNAAAIPAGLDPRREVVFSTLHGTFGEDGGMQTLLDAAGFQYAGCGARSSALTMDKSATKSTSAAAGVLVAKELAFAAAAKPRSVDVMAALGERVVMKPNDQGSSVGLVLAAGETEIAAGLAGIVSGNWLIEPWLVGRELSIGVLGGQAMGVVEIRPKSGVYDFTSKYTKGMTEYFAPAALAETVAAKVRHSAELAYAACGCRDYARVDFILCGTDELYLLEINTLPGMKETSLLPMSARCIGQDFPHLVRELVNPAVQRFIQRQTSTDS